MSEALTFDDPFARLEAMIERREPFDGQALRRLSLRATRGIADPVLAADLHETLVEYVEDVDFVSALGAAGADAFKRHALEVLARVRAAAVQ